MHIPLALNIDEGLAYLSLAFHALHDTEDKRETLLEM